MVDRQIRIYPLTLPFSASRPAARGGEEGTKESANHLVRLQGNYPFRGTGAFVLPVFLAVAFLLTTRALQPVLAQNPTDMGSTLRRDLPQSWSSVPPVANAPNGYDTFTASARPPAPLRPFPAPPRTDPSRAAFAGYQPMFSPYPAGGPPPGSVVTLPDEMPIELPPVEEYIPTNPKISEFKNGFFQKASFTATYIDRGDAADVGITDLETFFTVAVPAPTKKSPLMISPSFGVHYFDGPSGAGGTPLPSRVHDSFVEFRWLTMWTDRFGMEVAAIPGVYSDFERWDDDALRIKGRFATLYKWTPTMSFVLGVTYLDREDFNVLPIVGVVWTPNEDWRYELVFPKAKISRRFGCGPDWVDWYYLAAEFGGDSYSIERIPGTSDILTYRDVRFRLGMERKRNGGGGRFLEVGYVVGRQFEFASGLPDYEPDDAIMVRAGFAY